MLTNISHIFRVIGILAGTFALACTNPYAPSGTATGNVEQRTMTYDGRNYPFVVYVPTTYQPSQPLPALLLVHGGGGNGPEFISYWKDFAQANGIILVAPTLDLSAEAETRVPEVFPRIMETVQTEWNVDVSRRYVFGYSAGGYFVYDAALLNANYFAGAAVFAAVIQPEYDWIVAQAQRKTGIAIYLGDHDSFFTFQQARRTRDLLLSHGMDVHYVELSETSHDYSLVAASVNADAWAYLSTRRLR